MIPSGARGILAASITLSVLAILAVALRVLARRKVKASLQRDDWTIILNMVIYIASFLILVELIETLEGDCGCHKCWDYLCLLYRSPWYQLRRHKPRNLFPLSKGDELLYRVF